MKIALMQSYFRRNDPKEWSRKMPYPPLGCLYLSSVLKQKNHIIHYFDGMLAESENEGLHFLLGLECDVLLLYDDEFNYLTKMCLSDMRGIAEKLIHSAKQKGMKVGVYSSDATDHSDLYLSFGADVVFVGEAESTVSEWLDAVEKSLSIDNISGLRFVRHNNVIATESRKAIENLDALPIPDYDLIDLEKYRSIWQKNHGYFSLNVSTTRGCPFHCNWCAKPIYGQVYHVHSPQRIAEIFLQLKQKYRVDHIWITDDIFGLKPNWLKQFADELQKSNTQIPYKCLSRADLLLKNNTIEMLKKSGCEIVWIGAESGSQKILDAMDKGTSVQQITEASKLLKANHIQIAYFIQFGYSGENYDDISLTRKMILENLPDDIGISVSYPLPGTKFYQRVKEKLGQKTNWKHSDDLEMMFDGTYTSDFYRQLYKVVHREYRLKKMVKKPSFSRNKLISNLKTLLGGVLLQYDKIKLNRLTTSVKPG